MKCSWLPSVCLSDDYLTHRGRQAGEPVNALSMDIEQEGQG